MIQRAITDPDPGNQPGYVDQVAKDRRDIDRLIEAYAATKLVPGEERGLAAWNRSWPRYQRAYRTVLDEAGAGRDDAAIAAYFRAARPLYLEVDTQMAGLAKVNDEVARQLDADIGATAPAARHTTLALLLVAILAGGAVALVVVRRIVAGVRQVADAAEAIADGELDRGRPRHLGRRDRPDGRRLRPHDRLPARARRRRRPHRRRRPQRRGAGPSPSATASASPSST
jgi:methyl-accepting chemotaxis protein